MMFASILAALIAQAAPAPACAMPNREASVVVAAPIAPPPGLRDPTTALVEVTIGPAGNLVVAMIYKSGGSIDFDKAAIAAARRSVYSPKYVNCVPATGDYLFRADFDPNAPSISSPPRFTPSKGWTSVNPHNGNLPFDQLQWSDGKGDSLTEFWMRDMRGLAEVEREFKNYPASAYVKIVLLTSEHVKVCHNSQDALHVVYTSSSPERATSIDETDIAKNGVLYSIQYSSLSGTAPADLLAAMDTFCSP